MKIIYFVGFVFALSLSKLQAQDADPVKGFKYIFKANINYSYRGGHSTIGNVSPDWVIKNKKGNLHELELSGISINRFDYSPSGKFKTSTFRVRYQYDIAL